MPVHELPPIRVPTLSILDDAGGLDASLDPGLSDEDALRLYRFMLLARVLDGRMLNLQRQGRLGTFPPTTGQEATAVGAALAMGPQDWLVPTYRELAARLVRGEDPLQSLRYYNGFEEGSTTPRDLRILPYQVVLGTQVPHAVGIGFARKGRGEAVLVFFGDGASSEGDVHEALNFAGVWKAPVVFVCVNNQWAISTPLSKQTATPSFAYRAAGYGIPGVQVDGNDPLAVYAAVRDGLERARRGEGPTLVEALTFRLLMHTTADDPTKYRDEAVTREMWTKEPLVRTRKWLQDRGLLDAERAQSIDAEVQAVVEDAVKRLESETIHAPDAPFDHVLSTPSPYLERQRAAFHAGRLP